MKVMNIWNKSIPIDFIEYQRRSVGSKKDDLIVIKKAPNCNYCYFCHEGVSGGYRVIVKDGRPVTGHIDILEVLSCYECYSKLMKLEFGIRV